jgi:hypothetical protein
MNDDVVIALDVGGTGMNDRTAAKQGPGGRRADPGPGLVQGRVGQAGEHSKEGTA